MYKRVQLWNFTQYNHWKLDDDVCEWGTTSRSVMIPHTTSILLSLVTISNVVQRPYSNLPIKIAAFSYLLKKWRANWCLLREPLSINQVPWIRSIYHIYHFLESDSEIELEPIRNAATLTSSTHSSRIETHVVRGGKEQCNDNSLTFSYGRPPVTTTPATDGYHQYHTRASGSAFFLGIPREKLNKLN